MKKIFAWTIVSSVLLWGIVLFVDARTSGSETAKMVGIADGFNVPAAWKLVDERIQDHQLICLGADPCPSMSRRWQADKQLMREDLQRVLESSGMSFRIDGDCTRPPNRHGNLRMCFASSVHGSYAVTIAVDSVEPGADSLLGLNIRPAGN